MGVQRELVVESVHSVVAKQPSECAEQLNHTSDNLGERKGHSCQMVRL